MSSISVLRPKRPVVTPLHYVGFMAKSSQRTWPQATWRTLFLQSRPGAQDSKAVERAGNVPRHLDHMRVDHRRLQTAVTKQQLYRPDVGT